MFVRSKVVKGRTYYQLVESYRAGKKDGGDGRVRHRTIASLGRYPTLEEFYPTAEDRYFARFRAGKFSDREANAAWKKLNKLADLLSPERRRQMSVSFRIEEARRRELSEERSRVRAEKQRARQEEERREWEEGFSEWAKANGVTEEGYARWQEAHGFAEDSASRPNTAVCYALLDLAPPVTLDQLKEAYRRKSLECHPDRGGSDAKMKGVNLAYDTLFKELRWK
jgi:hypothetical protein